MLWFAVQERAGQKIAYVYDVMIHPDHQRKGLGTQAFHALEDRARALGLSGIALHVFGHNEEAHDLYLRLGFRPPTSACSSRSEGAADADSLIR